MECFQIGLALLGSKNLIETIIWGMPISDFYLLKISEAIASLIWDFRTQEQKIDLEGWNLHLIYLFIFPFTVYYFFLNIFIGVQLLYNGVLVSAL